MKKKEPYVIPGTCPVCGYVPGTVGKPLTRDERAALIDKGHHVRENAIGDDIADLPSEPGYYSDARAVYHHVGHPKPKRPTWHERVLADD